MASFSDRLSAVRERRPLLDHILSMQEHYSGVKAGQQAGGVTYYGFLSFFPILALAVFVVGLVSEVYPAANADLIKVVDDVLPGIIGSGDGEISLSDIRTFSGWAAVVGVLGVLYSGLGWLSALRTALVVVFEKPEFAQLSFVVGKLRDLATLVTLGLTLFLTVAVTGFVRGFSDVVLDFLGLDSTLGWVVGLVSIGIGLAANTLLFFLIFRLLADPDLPRRSMWSGALLGGIAFELLKLLSQYLLQATKDQPAFQAFGIALILVVWINYFSRVVLYAASWAYTTRAARAGRLPGDARPVQGPRTPSLVELTGAPGAGGAGGGRGGAASAGDAGRRGWLAPFAGGAVAMLGAVAVVRKRHR